METQAPKASATRRRALLIGIDEYPYVQPLAGCVNDVGTMNGLLQQRFNFPSDGIEQLLNHHATAAALRAAFERLIAQTAEGDVVVIHYSGHGSQMANRLALGGQEETIVPVDSRRDWGTDLEAGAGTIGVGDIGDLEIRHWLLQLTARTPYVTLIFDSCHSGHILRDSFGAVGRWVEADRRPVSELPALPEEVLREVRRGTLTREAAPGGAGAGNGTGFRQPLGSRYAMVAGCRAEETSFEFRAADAGGIRHGAFTYFLAQELAKAGPETTLRDVFEAAAPRVNGCYSTQHPQIEGARDRQVFGIADLEPMRFVPVRRDPAGVVLLAGAACGMTQGSTWAVYPPGTKSAGGGVLPLGHLEVTRVRALDSLARVVEGTVPAAGGRAVEETHRLGEARLAVEVKVCAPLAAEPAFGGRRLRTPFGVGGAASAEALRQGIRDSPLLCLAEDPEAAPPLAAVRTFGPEAQRGAPPPERDAAPASAPAPASAAARAYLLPARAAAADGDPVPAAGPLAEDSWAVVGADGELLMPVHAVSEPGVAQLLVENLEKRARFRAVLDLADPQGPLAGKVEVAVLGKEGKGAGGWKDRGTESAEPVFRVGEEVAFRVTHSHASPLFFYLLDLGLSGAISIVYPEQGGQQKAVPAGEENALLIGGREGEEISLFLPEGFPYGGAPAARDAGWVEAVKLFATTREIDLFALTQGSVRGDDTPLSRLLQMSMTGKPMRELAMKRAQPDGDWTVVQRSLRLVPG